MHQSIEICVVTSFRCRELLCHPNYLSVALGEEPCVPLVIATGAIIMHRLISCSSLDTLGAARSRLLDDLWIINSSYLH
jgi:hypothetical protein